MKSVLITVLLTVLTMHLVGPLLVTGWFYAQQSKLAQEHCENKSRPELNCDGQCFLAKKLEAYYAADRTVADPEPVPTFLPLVFQAPIPIYQAISLCEVNFPEEAVLWPNPISSRVFHPPRWVQVIINVVMTNQTSSHLREGDARHSDESHRTCRDIRIWFMAPHFPLTSFLPFDPINHV